MTYSDTSRRDIQAETEAILRTSLLLGRPYGMDYIARILRGDDKFGFRHSSHEQFETYGLFSELYAHPLLMMAEHLAELGFLEVTDPSFGSMQITDAGTAYLEDPHSIMVEKSSLHYTSWVRLLTFSLKRVRKAFAEEAGLPVYEIFSNYVLRQLVKRQPRSLALLKTVPGLAEGHIPKYGAAIVEAIIETDKQPEKVQQEYRIAMAFTPGHQAVKELLANGKSFEEMVQSQASNPFVMHRRLQHLHEAGEIDLLDWIEKNVPKDQFQTGISYFRENEKARLKPAQERLKLDYEVLSFCKFYAEQRAA